MASVNIDIVKLLSQSFGGSYSPLLNQAEGTALTPYPDVQTYGQSAQTNNSIMGTPIISPVAFGAVNYYTTEGALIQFAGIDLGPAVLIEFSRSKKIVVTEIGGADGEVNEFIGHSDWRVIIRGVLIGTDSGRTYPKDLVEKLRELEACTSALPIYNDIAELLKIDSLIITDIDFPALEAQPGVQPFTLTCKSEKTFELQSDYSIGWSNDLRPGNSGVWWHRWRSIAHGR